MINIEGNACSGFPGADAQFLSQLSFEGRKQWLRYRFELVFLNPFRRLVGMEEQECYIWLCVVSLMGAAIGSLANFEFTGSDHNKFGRFLEAYLPNFANAGFRLDDPRVYGRHRATSASEHFYKYFRSGLAHSFCIEWGGLKHREELPLVGESYLFQTTQGNGGEHGLGVIPRELVVEFLAGTEHFFDVLRNRTPDSQAGQLFNQCFERVYLNKARGPLP